MACANTDSVSFVARSQNFGDLLQDWEKLNAALRERLGSAMYQFQLEKKKFALIALYSQKIKQCMRIVCDLDEFMKLLPAIQRSRTKDIVEYVQERLKKMLKELPHNVEFVTSFSLNSISLKRREQIKKAVGEILLGSLETDALTLAKEVVMKQEQTVQKDTDKIQAF
jgi:hypothetical protein